MWRVVKSPLNTVTQFTNGDKYLNEAIDAFLRAVELSEWENTAAVYDLALLYRNIGELELAKEYLDKSLCRERSLGIFGKINAFEQLGLILKDLAENCTCSQEKKTTSGEQPVNAAHGFENSISVVCQEPRYPRSHWRHLALLPYPSTGGGQLKAQLTGQIPREGETLSANQKAQAVPRSSAGH